MKLEDARIQYDCQDGILYADDLQDGTRTQIGIYELRSGVLHIRLLAPAAIYPGLTPSVMSTKLNRTVNGIAIGYI